MYDKAADDNALALEFVPDQCKTQEMCIKAVDDYPNANAWKSFSVKILSW